MWNNVLDILYRLGFSWDEGNPDSSLLYIEEHTWREYFIKPTLMAVTYNKSSESVLCEN